jgi:hypothetical protein
MKNIVVFDEYNEIDLKPSTLLKEYIKLTQQDVSNILIKPKELKECPCPACKDKGVASSFDKFGLTYNECPSCHTLYISPRNDETTLNHYYTEAQSRKFWRDELSKATDKKRKEKVIKPRFDWIVESTQEYLPEARHYVDVNTNQYGYTEEIAKTGQFEKKTLINPFLNLKQISNNNSFNIIDTPWQDADLKAEVDVISLFEVCDRTANIDNLFDKINNALKSRGLIFITTILISGFDLQTLWENAENLFPPDRLNVFSVEGLQAVFKRHNLECLELSTPGILDVEIVSKAALDNPDIDCPRFVKYLLKNRDDNTKVSFQEFLQANLLSSYGRILLRKK